MVVNIWFLSGWSGSTSARIIVTDHSGRYRDPVLKQHIAPDESRVAPAVLQAFQNGVFPAAPRFVSEVAAADDGADFLRRRRARGRCWGCKNELSLGRMLTALSVRLALLIPGLNRPGSVRRLIPAAFAFLHLLRRGWWWYFCAHLSRLDFLLHALLRLAVFAE